MGDEQVFRVRRWRAGVWQPALVLTLGVVVAGAGTLVPGSARGSGWGTYWLVLGAAFVAVGAVALVRGRRAPLGVTAGPTALQVHHRACTRVVRWQDVLRVRGTDLSGFTTYDRHLELVDTSLVTLPEGLAGGTVQRWRTRLGAPAAELGPDGPPTRWRVPVRELPWGHLVHLPMLVLITTAVVSGYSVTVLAVLLVLGLVAAVGLQRRFRRPLFLAATAAGLDVPTWRGSRTRVAWDDLADVRGKEDPWDQQQVLELTDGTTVDLPRDVPAHLVQEWRSTLTRPGGPDQVR